MRNNDQQIRDRFSARLIRISSRSQTLHFLIPMTLVLLICSIFTIALNAAESTEQSKKRIVKVAILQQPRWEEGETPEAIRAWQMKWILKHLDQAGKAHADIACMGEGAINMQGLTLPDCPALDTIRENAKKHKMYIIFPVVAKRNGTKHNTAIVIGRDGAITGYYDKVHPTQTELKKGVVRGDDFPVFKLDFGTIGIQICHDLSFPESSRVFMLKGAELVFWPTWWSGWGQELDWIVIRSRAIDNDQYLAVVSRGVKHGAGWKPRDPIGRSGIVDPYGQILSNIGYEAGLIITEVDLNRRRIAPSFSSNKQGELFRDSVLNDRNPKAYRIISDTSKN
jgi:predicted amidohydrolase